MSIKIELHICKTSKDRASGPAWSTADKKRKAVVWGCAHFQIIRGFTCVSWRSSAQRTSSWLLGTHQVCAPG